jgi:hypothetical protein
MVGADMRRSGERKKEKGKGKTKERKKEIFRKQ